MAKFNSFLIHNLNVNLLMLFIEINIPVHNPTSSGSCKTYLSRSIFLLYFQQPLCLNQI